MQIKKKYIINNLNEKNKKIKSIEGYDCVGQCYPPNTYYYNPLNLSLIYNPYPSCPIKPIDAIKDDNTVYKKMSAKCNFEDIGEGESYYDIFSDNIQISTSPNNFLSEIYELNNISDVVNFLSNTVDTLPIYSQRRLLKAIFEVYYKYVEFPKMLFCKKLLFVLKNIYKISDIDVNDVLSKLNDFKDKKHDDLYKIFI